MPVFELPTPPGRRAQISVVGAGWKTKLAPLLLLNSAALLIGAAACSSAEEPSQTMLNSPAATGDVGATSTATGTAAGGATTLGTASAATTVATPGVTSSTGISAGASSTTSGTTATAATTTGSSTATAATTTGSSTATATTAAATNCAPAEQLEPFSFFVTSYRAMQTLSGSEDGFGGDLRYGEADGLTGADKICAEVAELSMQCASQKQWRAFLSTSTVDAVDRIGDGPWYDRTGRVVAMTKMDLINQRPVGADPAIAQDLPNEDGVPNHAPDGELVDNHDTLTGSNSEGRLYTDGDSVAGSTCNDWTSAEPSGAPRCGHTWPTGVGGMGGPGGSGFVSTGGGGGGIGDLAHWISALDEAGCAPGAFLVEAGPPGANGTRTVGDGGGYGGIYCFALIP